jgi:hypothetical protein
VRIALLISALTVAGAHAQSGTRSPVAPTGLIVGRVVDAAGRPVSGAIVDVGIGGRLPPRVPPPPAAIESVPLLTGPDGFFVFRDLPLGSITVTVTKSGYSEGSYGRRRPGGPAQPVPLTSEEPRREIVVTLWKHAAINGIVIDEIGEPLMGVAIQSFRRAEVGGGRRYIPGPAATTDDRGVYRIANLPPGEYLVAAWSRQIAAPLSMARDARDRSFTFSPGEALEVVPAPGSASGLQLGDSVYALELDGVTPPPPDKDRLSIYPPTFYPGATSALDSIAISVRSGEDREGIDLQLRPARTVRVSGVLNGPADMLAMRRLRLVPVDNDLLERAHPVTSTDARGAFVFPAVPAGEYSLRARLRAIDARGDPARALLWADLPISVNRDDLDELVVPLRPGSIVSGSLAFDGTSPRPGGASLVRTRIVVERADTGLPGSEPAASVVVDDTGQFSTTGLTPGSYFVRVTDSPVGWMFKGAMYNGRDLSEHPIEVRDDLAGISIEFTDRWTGLRGIITTPTGQIDSGALILVFPTDSSRWRAYTPGARRIRSARVSPDGEFSFASIPVGDYYVAAIGDEDGANWQDADFLDVLSRRATRVTIDDGDQKTITLRKRHGRR